MFCPSVAAVDVSEVESVPEIFSLHHFLSSKVVKDWMICTAQEVAGIDTFLKEQKERHEIAVARLKNGQLTFQCTEGEYHDHDNRTGYLCCDQYLFDNDTWAIYPAYHDDFRSNGIKHNINATLLNNYWRQEIKHFWSNSTQFLAGTVLDGKIIDRWCPDTYQNRDGNIEACISPRFRDENGNTWNLGVFMYNFREPDRVEEGSYYHDLSMSSFSISARVLPERYALPINYNEFVLGPIVYHY